MKSHIILINRSLDVLCLGGFALGLAILSALTRTYEIDFALPTSSITPLLFFSSFPHFSGSYLVFYRQEKVFKRFPWASWCVPVILVLSIVVGNLFFRDDFSKYLGFLGLALLYWHYLKQSFGVSLWLMRNPHSSEPLPVGKNTLLVLCVILGLTGWVQIQSASSQMLMFGAYIPTLGFSKEYGYFLRAISSVFVLSILIFGFLKEKKREGAHNFMMGMVPLLSLWTWVEPSFHTQWYLALLPVFHGCQYLPFLYHVLKQKDGGATINMALHLTFIGALGIILFWGLPKIFMAEGFPTFGMFAWLWFLNVHHYFIDGAMWRLNREDVRRHLLGTFNQA